MFDGLTVSHSLADLAARIKVEHAAYGETARKGRDAIQYTGFVFYVGDECLHGVFSSCEF